MHLSFSTRPSGKHKSWKSHASSHSGALYVNVDPSKTELNDVREGTTLSPVAVTAEDKTPTVDGYIFDTEYNGNVQVRKNITSIALSKVDDASKYKATFTQSILIDKDSASLKDIDKDKGVIYVNARVLDYVKEVNGIEVKGQYPYNKQFEFELNLDDIN